MALLAEKMLEMNISKSCVRSKPVRHARINVRHNHLTKYNYSIFFREVENQPRASIAFLLFLFLFFI